MDDQKIMQSQNLVDAVSNRVTRAWDAGLAGETGEALYHICSAVENTLKREGYKANAMGYKTWLMDNMPIITGIGFGISLSGISLARSSDLSVEPASLQQIIYTLVRCGLYHQGNLDDDVVFTEKTLASGPPYMIPKTFVAGLILAVIASPCNMNGRTKIGYFYKNDLGKFRLQDWWGKKEELLAMLTLRGNLN